jgi:hypothetical protein
VAAWPDASWEHWNDTCDTLHAFTQVLGKIARALAPPEPQLQHAALRLTARGWETAPLPVPGGALNITLDLRRHEAIVEDGAGSEEVYPLTQSVGQLTREIVSAARELGGGDFEFNATPSEVPWTVPLDEDEEHRTYDPDPVRRYHVAALGAASVLAGFRAPYRGRSTPVHAWWGSFDLAVSLFSGREADPPSNDFIMRNSMDAEDFAFGWWPGDARYPHAAFYAYSHPARAGFGGRTLELGRWDETLGEYILDAADVESPAQAVAFAHTLFDHACAVCDWDPTLLSAPPVV